MRVLIMMSSLAMGGAERTVVDVLPHLLAAGATPVLCTLNTRRDSTLAVAFSGTGIERIDLEARRLLDRAAWQRLRKLLETRRFDLIHTQDQDTHCYGALARWRLDTPVVMTRHVLREPTDTPKETARAGLVLLAARFGADRLVAVSGAVREQFARQTRLPAARIETIYNGIDVARFATRGMREAKRRELRWPDDQRVVLMVAVLRRGKGHDILFRAIPHLSRLVPGVKVKIVGEGELSALLREQASELGDSVEFLGERADVPDLLGAADALVLPSWNEALPTVLIEAGAASLPVVATNVGGAPEIVREGETGYLVEPGDAAAIADRLTRVLNDPPHSRTMGESARRRVTEIFSLERQAQHMVAVYKSVLAHRGVRSEAS
jgi:glycosyltransferase involved in cell wall biosynthesis